MNDKHGKNTAASVRNQLLALARERGEDFQLLLTQYGLERLLYRLRARVKINSHFPWQESVVPFWKNGVVFD